MIPSVDGNVADREVALSKPLTFMMTGTTPMKLEATAAFWVGATMSWIVCLLGAAAPGVHLAINREEIDG
jgi:hypothetical protein